MLDKACMNPAMKASCYPKCFSRIADFLILDWYIKSYFNQISTLSALGGGESFAKQELETCCLSWSSSVHFLKGSKSQHYQRLFVFAALILGFDSPAFVFPVQCRT